MIQVRNFLLDGICQCHIGLSGVVAAAGGVGSDHHDFALLGVLKGGGDSSGCRWWNIKGERTRMKQKLGNLQADLTNI